MTASLHSGGDQNLCPLGNRLTLPSGAQHNLLLAWVLTLPAAMALSGFLYWLFSHVF